MSELEGAERFNACEYLLDRRVKAGDGGRLAVTGTGGDLTYDQLLDRVQRTAAALRDRLEKPVAYVMLRPGGTATEAELIEFCRAGLPTYKRPRRVVFTDAYPTTATGKVRRVELRQMATALLAGAGPGAAGPPGG